MLVQCRILLVILKVAGIGKEAEQILEEEKRREEKRREEKRREEKVGKAYGAQAFLGDQLG